jgi:hypothetical protein
VAGVYLGCVALLTKISPFRGSVGIAVAVLAAAAVFNPLRRRVQAMVDRRFDRARYDAERVVAQFSVQLREQVDLDLLGNDLLGVVNHVLAPAHVTLWLSQEAPPGGNAGQDTFGTPEIPALPRSLAVRRRLGKGSQSEYTVSITRRHAGLAGRLGDLTKTALSVRTSRSSRRRASINEILSESEG